MPGSIPKAVAAARAVCGFSLRIDVECTSQAEAIQAIDAGADVVMLDNFSRAELETACKTLKEKYGESGVDKTKRRWLIEVSGGVTPENFETHVHPGWLRVCETRLRVPEGRKAELADTFPDVDIISTSSIHQSVPHIDFSLKITPKKKAQADESDAL